MVWLCFYLKVVQNLLRTTQVLNRGAGRQGYAICIFTTPLNVCIITDTMRAQHLHVEMASWNTESASSEGVLNTTIVVHAGIRIQVHVQRTAW